MMKISRRIFVNSLNKRNIQWIDKSLEWVSGIALIDIFYVDYFIVDNA